MLNEAKEKMIEIARTIYASLPVNGISNPIFIIGCGRSGTTILGKVLSEHKSITYLNEPRHLWSLAYPQTDIWSSKAYSQKGKLLLTESDVEYKRSNVLSKLFQFETIRSGRPLLVEKLPINNFRLKFILEIFPKARFIHIYRNGLEVANSIDVFCKKADWFGVNYYKWDKLVEVAISQSDTKKLPSLCSTNFEKGLLEWRLSTEAAVTFLTERPKETFLELNYHSLVEQPQKAIMQVLNFLNIGNDSRVDSFASNEIFRRSPKVSKEMISQKSKTIGGELLLASMNTKKMLTNGCKTKK